MFYLILLTDFVAAIPVTKDAIVTSKERANCQFCI